MISTSLKLKCCMNRRNIQECTRNDFVIIAQKGTYYPIETNYPVETYYIVFYQCAYIQYMATRGNEVLAALLLVIK